MRRRVRPWWLALAASLLLHVGLLGGMAWRWLPGAPPAEPSTLEVQLASPPAPTAAPPRPKPPLPKTVPLHRPVAVPPPPPAVEAPSPPADEPIEIPQPPAVPSPAAVGGEEAAAPVAEAAAPPPLNALPPRIDMRFELRYGLASGEQTLVWVNEGEHYTVTSVAAATGLTGLFYRGRFAQTSRGRITPTGLQPQEFWDQRGEKRSSARFDAASGDLAVTPAQGPVRHFGYNGTVQDALSLFFQFALTAPPPEGRQRFTVFNGRKLREYTYEVRGEEMLDTALGPLRTLHLVRAGDDDGRFEAWLAIDRHYLPVRVLRSDASDSTMELRVQSIAP
ncbi:DUF3108 domain-containing protein [Thiobacillus sedimenti]|uniref:DUF3108 domain-containing protein n=1 Tax=Thiobacillus sedimenti TaxID=3110231 RepID=A0ABZ1CIC9_9PROT|nr:DUF3108 domain-containing protein [Thiobacillus sp. SCUT-2]WRS39129.1 DUF3108 domain-containing protein [Thiobacillus sp. SCUT-2]